MAYREKSIQIPETLFFEMAAYCLIPETQTPELRRTIQRGVDEKLDRRIEHDLYTRYKTAPTEAQKEKARQEYLEKRGVKEDWRWSADYDKDRRGAKNG